MAEDSSKDMTYECRHCYTNVADLPKHYAFDCEILHPSNLPKDITSVVERDAEGRINLDDSDRK